MKLIRTFKGDIVMKSSVFSRYLIAYLQRRAAQRTAEWKSHTNRSYSLFDATDREENLIDRVSFYI